MPTPDAPAGGVEVVGQLSILADGTPLGVECRGGAIEVTLPDLRAASALRRRFSRRDRRAWTRHLQAILGRAGLELRVRVGRHQVGRLSADSRRGWFAAGLGVDPFELKLGAVLAALFGRARPGPEPK